MTSQTHKLFSWIVFPCLTNGVAAVAADAADAAVAAVAVVVVDDGVVVEDKCHHKEALFTSGPKRGR